MNNKNSSKQLFKGSAIVSLFTFLGHIFSIGLKLLISRLYGMDGFGLYSLMMALSRSLTSIVQMGYNQSIVHFITKFNIRGNWNNIKSYFLAGLRRIAVNCLLITFAIFIFRNHIIEIFSLQDESVKLSYFVGIMAIFAINNYISAVLRGLKYFKAQSILSASVYPLTMVISILLINLSLGGSSTLPQFLSFGILLNFVILSICTVILFRFLSKKNSNDQNEDIKKLSKYSFPVWMSSILKSAFMRSDRIMLGIFSSIQEVGLYGAGLTYSILFSFPLKAMGPVFQPLIIEYYMTDDHAGMNKLYNTMIRWSSYFVIPTFGGIICFGGYFLQLFGKEFISGYSVMIVLSFAQLISTLSGTAGTFLNMAEKQKTHTKIMAVGFMVTILLNLILIPKFGALGAAIGTSISIIIINGIRVKKVIKHFGIHTNYSPVIWMIVKCAPIVYICLKLLEIYTLYWILLLFGFTITSGIIVYYSLKESEKKFLTKRLNTILNANA